MTLKEIIEEKLFFLCSEYGLKFEYKKEGMQEYYSYSNDIGCFVYYNCPQLYEEEFYVTVYKEKNIKIDWLLEYPKEITSFKKRIKGIKYLLKNWRKDYWELIASLIKKEIQEKNSLFGLRIDKKCF